jgi:hypothetical protein
MIYAEGACMCSEQMHEIKHPLCISYFTNYNAFIPSASFQFHYVVSSFVSAAQTDG